jgi:hypothetical protein
MSDIGRGLTQMEHFFDADLRGNTRIKTFLDADWRGYARIEQEMK